MKFTSQEEYGLRLLVRLGYAHFKGIGLTIPEISIKDYWFGEKRTKIQSDLEQNGGRRKYSYCSTCPRT
jgi:hypothetical protein